jgi:hypothetical protein
MAMIHMTTYMVLDSLICAESGAAESIIDIRKKGIYFIIVSEGRDIIID